MHPQEIQAKGHEMASQYMESSYSQQSIQVLKPSFSEFLLSFMADRNTYMIGYFNINNALSLDLFLHLNKITHLQFQED